MPRLRGCALQFGPALRVIGPVCRLGGRRGREQVQCRIFGSPRWHDGRLCQLCRPSSAGTREVLMAWWIAQEARRLAKVRFEYGTKGRAPIAFGEALARQKRDAFSGTHPLIPVWLAAMLLGMLFWTPIEYLLHRFVFRHVPVIEVMHDRHHRDPA